MQKSARIVLGSIILRSDLVFYYTSELAASAWLSPWDVAREVFRGNRGDNDVNNIIWPFRLPRATTAVFVGAILGVSGVSLQTLFRNPLAEPYVVGASSGELLVRLGFDEWFSQFLLGSAHAGVGF